MNILNSLPIAYIDGGSASMLFQAVIGGALAASYFAATRFRSAVSWVRNLRRSHDA